MYPALLLAGVIAAASVTDRAPAPAPDSTLYAVLNHGRPAGAMLVVRDGDSLRVHYRHVDRNRGTRYELRYRLAGDGTSIAGIVRTLGLDDGVPAPESGAFRVDGDSIRWRVGTAERAAPRTAGVVRLPGAGPMEQALLAQGMLRRGESRTALLPAGSARLEIAADTTVTTQHGRVRVRLALLHRATGYTPEAVWSVRIPAGAQRVDATGRTVIPGLWEMHSHLQTTTATSGGIQQLARGITTTRDLVADTDVAVAYRDGVDRGDILGPRTLLGGFIEGPGAWAGPSDALARTEEEARALVARYHELGYRQIKLYNLVHPDLVPTIASEARARGLRLSGHVPRGLSTDAAVRLGFDEINHAAFLFSTFYQDSLYTPAMRPYSGVAQVVAPRIDVDGPAMDALLRTFVAHGTIIDGTFSLWYRGFDARSAPNGAAPATAVDSANTNWLRLVKRLHDAGLTLVPGTDNQGSATYVNELELYVRAGIPAATVLQMATLTSARVMGEDQDRGSIAVGQAADLAIVDGNPLDDIGVLRRVHRVLLDGRVYDPARLLEAIGVGGR
jgi:imidazolonepropionase-like amidohydrolase